MHQKSEKRVGRANDRPAGRPHPGPPHWAQHLVGGLQVSSFEEVGPHLALRIVEHDGFALTSALVRDAIDMDANLFREEARNAYQTICTTVGALHAPHPVRIWNFIPGILEPLGELPHRYMVFNSGRFLAFKSWFECESKFAHELPTATGTGWFEDDLAIHCLSAKHSGEPIENPRQVSSYRYSPRYGPRPPCFARATRLGNGNSLPWLLVGGTASVRGEDSAHANDLQAQLDETAMNLSALVGSALGSGHCNGHDTREMLGLFRQVRVYYPNPEHAAELRSALTEQFPMVKEVELVQSDLCRPELLLEIEGVADLPES